MKGVILAAGCGTRLSTYSQHSSKMLLPVGGRPLIDHTLEAFAQVGVTDVAVVTGYQGNVLMERVGDGSRQGLHIEYVPNPDYEEGNALSVYVAKAFTGGEPFLLSMGDHMVSPDLVARLLDTDGSANVLAVDFTLSARNIEEGTRVLVNPQGRVTRIGKRLTEWNGTDAGAFRLTSSIFDAIASLIDEGEGQYELSLAITRMMGHGDSLQARDVSGCFWHDVDTWEDLNLVRQAVGR